VQVSGFKLMPIVDMNVRYSQFEIPECHQTNLDGDKMTTRKSTWTAPVNLTEKMLKRMVDNGDWGGMSKEQVTEQLRGAWAEARYAFDASEVAAGQ